MFFLGYSDTPQARIDFYNQQIDVVIEGGNKFSRRAKICAGYAIAASLVSATASVLGYDSVASLSGTTAAVGIIGAFSNNNQFWKDVNLVTKLRIERDGFNINLGGVVA